jgi:hypothetical protein
MRSTTPPHFCRAARITAVLAAVCSGVFLAGGLLAGGLMAPAIGQEPAVASSEPPARVGEIGPEIYYLQDEGGRLVPVPGFRYRDFVELFKMQEGLPGGLQPPPAVLEKIDVRLDLRAAAALPGETAPATVECTVRQIRSGWVNVPVDLGGMLIAAPPTHEGPGRVMLDAEPPRDGQPPAYRLWFDAVPAATGDTRHTVTLEGRIAVERAPRAVAVGLRLPPATTSLVTIENDEPDPIVTVASPPAPPRAVASVPGDPIEIAGLVGPVRLRVAGREAATGGWTTVPQSTVESLVRIDGRNAFIEATIRLENLRPDTNRVRVSLPTRTTLRRVGGAGTLVSRGGTDESATVEIAIDRDAEGRATLEIDCERPIDAARGRSIELIGFAVTGVPPWRQWGRVTLFVEGDWRAEWPDVPGIRRVDPPAALRRPGFVASFSYDAQPASLPLKVQPRPSRVVIEPEYRYHVAATRLALVARARVTARGAPATEVIMELPGLAGGVDGGADGSWAIEEVGPPTLVDATAITIAGDVITVPFFQSLGGDATIEIRASRRLPREATELEWSLPMPRADLVVPAAVSITADSDIEVLFDASRSRGLVRQVAAGTPRAVGEGEAAALLYRLDAVAGRFVGSRRFLPRRIDATIATRADVDETDIVVEQDVRLDVMHVPLDCVELVVADEILARGTLEIRQKDVLLEPLDPGPTGVSESALDPGLAGATRVIRVYPPEPIIGTGDLFVRYRLPSPSINPESTETTRLPLVLPGGARIDRQTLVIEAADTLAVDVPDEGWRRDVVPDERLRAWVAGKRQQTVRLAIATRPRASAGGLVVEAAWLRTELLADRREDIFSYVLGGTGERTTVTLPGLPGNDARTYLASLDGSPLPVAVTVDGGRVLELPRSVAGGLRGVSPSGLPVAPSGLRGGGSPRRRLEIRVAGPRGGDGWERWATRLRLPVPVPLTPPVFDSRVVERRFYWEITAREDDHLLARPSRWTSQQRWAWNRTGLASAPIISSAALAEWLALTADPFGGEPVASPTAPRLVERRAVYSGVGSPGAATMWLVPTWCLVLASSGTMLLLGLAIVYIAGFRRPVVVVALLAAGVLAAAAQPALAPLLVQTALPGAALAVLAWLLRVVFDRRDVGREPVAAAVSPSSLTRSLELPPSLIVSRSSVQQRPDGHGQDATATIVGRSAS